MLVHAIGTNIEHRKFVSKFVNGIQAGYQCALSSLAPSTRSSYFLHVLCHRLWFVQMNHTQLYIRNVNSQAKGNGADNYIAVALLNIAQDLLSLSGR